jgi:hypothetical protein
MKNITFELNGTTYKIPKILSIGDYVKIFKIKDFFEDEFFRVRLINIITGADMKTLQESPLDEITYLSNEILKLIPVERPTFSNKFELNGVEYGFLPEWKKMSFGEYADLDTLMTKKPDEFLNYLHIVTSILYRPITKKLRKGKFEIEKYDMYKMEQRAELFKDELDVEYALGAQFFFIQFARNYYNNTPISLKQRLMMEWMELKFLMRNWRKIWKLALNRDLDGLQFSTELQMMILEDTIQSSKKVLSKHLTNSAISSKKTNTSKS